MIYIIGSGLSGVAAAAALVQRGCRPTILDAGLTPDSVARMLKARMACAEPEDWSKDDVALLKRIGPPAPSGIPRKLHFGSWFPYWDVDPATSANVERASMHRSFALGGFSNVWGAVTQALPDREFTSWPITPPELAPHYAAARALLADGSGPRASVQARAFYRDLAGSRRELERRGIRFGYPDLAVRTADDPGGKGCRYCGLCLYGCPYDAIYNAGSTLARLVQEGRVGYLPGVIVDRLSPERGRVRIEARSLADGSSGSLEGGRVFVAAGLLETARIILNSLALYDTALSVQHSDIFTLPILRFDAEGDVARERLHTLCQLVVEIEDGAICRYPVRLQLYGYNDLYPQLLERRAGRLARPLDRALRAMSARLFIAFGYLHSDVSSRIRVTLSGREPAKLRLQGEPNPEARRIGRAVAQKLLRASRYLRAVAVPFQLRLDLPGGGYHTGGSFPMSRAAASLETDRWGCISSLPGIHLVDASVLPSVPAAALAFTVMANSHRIASECPLPHAE